MPKVGMEPIRRQQLIDATITVIAQVGLQAATLQLISKEAGLSTGIVSHYFGGKQGLIQATVRYLLSELRLHPKVETPQQRLMRIVDINFSDVQRAPNATRTWISFWAQSQHDKGLFRLQEVNKGRLVSNLKYSFRAFLPADEVEEAAQTTAALIDGYWLRCALADASPAQFELAKECCKRFIIQILARHSP